METTPASKNVGGQVLPAGAQPLRPDDPTAIGGHRLAGRLTAGRSRVVYLARDGRGDLVAVKTSRSGSGEAEVRRRLRREAACLQRLPAACTARLLVDGSRQAPPYLVSEYVEGPTLRDLVEDRGPLGSAPVRALAVALARALTAVHDARIAHCDVRPGNVILAPDGPRLMDFGAAEEVGAPGEPAARVTDDPMRPPPFGSGRSRDVFGWGCLVAYAATGRRGFAEADLDAPAAPALARELDGVQEPIRELVQAALADDPGRRPAARELLARLDGGPGPRPLPARPATPAARPVPVRDPATDSFPAPPTAARPAAGSAAAPLALGGPSTGSFAAPVPPDDPATDSFAAPAAPGGPGTGSFAAPGAPSGPDAPPVPDDADLPDCQPTEAFEPPAGASFLPPSGPSTAPFAVPPGGGRERPAASPSGPAAAPVPGGHADLSDARPTEPFTGPATTSPDPVAGLRGGREANAFAGPETRFDGRAAATSRMPSAPPAGVPERDRGALGDRHPRTGPGAAAEHATRADEGAWALRGTRVDRGAWAADDGTRADEGAWAAGGTRAVPHPAATAAFGGPAGEPPSGPGGPADEPGGGRRRGRALVVASALVLLTGACAAVVATTGSDRAVRSPGPADPGAGAPRHSPAHAAHRPTLLRRRGTESGTPDPAASAADASGAPRTSATGGPSRRHRSGGSNPGTGSSRPGGTGHSTKPVTSPSPSPTKTTSPSPTPTASP